MQYLIQHGARILVLGDRGAGKSSLINAAFGRMRAKTGVGLSVTQNITLHEASEECPVHIYDSKGFETFDTELDQIQKLVEERRVAAAKYHMDDPRRITEQLHAVWWVIDVIGGGRFQPEQMMKVYKILEHDGIPIMLVLNKCDAEDDFVQGVEGAVREHCHWASGIVPVVAESRLGPPRLRCHNCLSDDILINVRKKTYNCSCHGDAVPFMAHYGVDSLIQQTIQRLPDVVAGSFQRAQNVWLEGLDFAAQATIASFSTASGLLGAIPIPGARVFVVPSQVSMILALAGIYKVVMSKKTALHLCLSIATSSATTLPAYLLGEALKLVPYLGLAAMAVDASTAFASTVALGAVSMKLLRQVRSKAILGQEVGPQDLAEIVDHTDLRRMYQDLFQQLRGTSVTDGAK